MVLSSAFRVFCKSVTRIKGNCSASLNAVLQILALALTARGAVVTNARWLCHFVTKEAFLVTSLPHLTWHLTCYWVICTIFLRGAVFVSFFTSSNLRASLVAQTVKHLPAMQETRVWHIKRPNQKWNKNTVKEWLEDYVIQKKIYLIWKIDNGNHPIRTVKRDTNFREFPSSPMVRIPHIHCRGHGFDPACLKVQSKEKEEERNTNFKKWKQLKGFLG